MLKCKHILGMLMILSTSLSLWGSCPDSLFIHKIWKEAQPSSMKKLQQQLANCPDLVAEQAMTFHKLGIVYNSLSIFDTAVHYTQQALTIRQQSLAPYDINIARSHHNLGIFYKEQAQLQEAKKHFEASLNIHQHNDNPLQWHSQKEIANIYFKLGDFSRSEMTSKEVINYLEQSRIDTTLLALAYSDVGQCLNEQKKYKQALSYLKQASSLLDYISYVNEAIFHLNKGTSHFGLKKYDAAILAFQQANKLFLQEENYFEAAKTYSNMGLCFFKIGQYDKAQQLLQQGLNLSQEYQYEEIIAQAQDNIGELFFIKKDYTTALSYFEKSIKTLSLSVAFPSFEDLQFNVYKTDLITYLKDYARASEQLFLVSKKQEEVNKALAALTLADQLIDNIRANNIGQVGRLFWREQAFPIYEQAISLCYASEKPEAAYYFIEKSKAILLLEAIQQSAALKALPEDWQQQYSTLKKDFIEAQTEWNNVDKDTKAVSLKTLLAAQANLDAFNQKMKSHHPKIYQLIVQPDLLPLADFQDFLKQKEEQVAIQYFLGHHHIYALVLSQEKVWIHQYEDKATLEREMSSFLAFFEKAATIENRPQEYVDLAKKLYQNLLGVLLDSLSLEPQNLLIIPDGTLGYLPFEALISNQATQFSEAIYLLQSHAVRLGYSFTIMGKHLEKEVQTKEQEVVAFAPFAQAPETSTKYAPLSDDEVEEMQEILSIKVYKNQAATKVQFEQSIKNTSVVHVSSHAFSAPTADKPHIVFFDQAFYLSELYASDLTADLIILSACQTNIGQHKAGEGIMSLSRGFTFAGAKSLISSLWKVNAASTSEILVNFYKNLQLNKSKSEALQLAKKDYLAQAHRTLSERSPYYWAGLTYYGDDQGLLLKRKSMIFTYGLLGLFMLITGIGIGFWKFKKVR